jgi:hypothetical protein
MGRTGLCVEKRPETQKQRGAPHGKQGKIQPRRTPELQARQGDEAGVTVRKAHISRNPRFHSAIMEVVIPDSILDQGDRHDF